MQKDLLNPPANVNPIIIKIDNNRPDDVENTPIELFNAIERAFDFEKNEYPHINISTPSFQNYKHFCRMLFKKEFNGASLFIQMNKGHFPELNANKNPGITIRMVDKNEFGVVIEVPILCFASKNQHQQNMIYYPIRYKLSEYTTFNFTTNRGSSMTIYLYPYNEGER